MNNLFQGVAASALICGFAAPGFAQETPETEDASVQEAIVVTSAGKARTTFDTPITVNVIQEDELARFTFSSQADILRNLPGIKAEGGGGEVATNLRVRGFPTAGGYNLVSLLYDGVPTVSTFGLNSSAPDIYYKNDLGIERVEFVRAGAATVFGAGSEVGVVNYISKTGTDESEGTLQLEVAEEDRYRFDFATSGPLSIGSNNYFAVSGFYRYDEGPIKTGIPSEGFQIRGNLKHEFSDGSGALTLYGMVIDDAVIFYLPLPLSGDDLSYVPGNNGQTVYTLASSDFVNLSYPDAYGRYTTSVGDNVTTEGATFNLNFDKALGDGWSVNAKAKYSNIDHKFPLWPITDGVPISQQEYLTNRSLGAIGNATFTFADSGQALAASDRVTTVRVTDRLRPLVDATFEVSAQKEFEIGSTQHTATGGLYFANAEADDFNVIYGALVEFNNQPRLVNLSVNDVAGSISGTRGTRVVVSENGITAPGSGYTNRQIDSVRKAFYLADQIDSERWALDIGLRYEEIDLTRTDEGNQLVTVRTTPTLHPALRVNRAGNLVFNTFEFGDDALSWSVAGLYRLTDRVNVFASYTDGFFFPLPSSQGTRRDGSALPYNQEELAQAEVGLKFDYGRLRGTVTGYHVTLQDRVSQRELLQGGQLIVQRNIQDTEASGIELDLAYDLTDNLTVFTVATFEDNEITKDDTTPTNVGNNFLRKPTELVNYGVTYDNGRFDAALFGTYHGDTFTTDANTVPLEAYHLLRADAGYTFNLENGDRLRASLSVNNLLDTEGTSEGDPRNANQGTTGEFFVGRNELPRRVLARLTYQF